MPRSAAELKESWLAGLKHERRMSPHTLRAYSDDVERFLKFLAEHLQASDQPIADVHIGYFQRPIACRNHRRFVRECPNIIGASL